MTINLLLLRLPYDFVNCIGSSSLTIFFAGTNELRLGYLVTLVAALVGRIISTSSLESPWKGGLLCLVTTNIVHNVT